MKPDGSLTDLEMWSYWRDKYGHEYALKDYYLEHLQKDPVLNQCLTQIIMAKDMIDKRMGELICEKNERNGWEDCL